MALAEQTGEAYPLLVAHTRLGITLYHLSSPLAHEHLEQAVRLSDRTMEAYAYLALLRREQNRREEAIGIFGEYLRRDPWNTSARGFYNWLRR